jgi:hypothetical protein
MPGEVGREALWKLHLPKTIPGSDEMDLHFLAKQYQVTGGQITIIVKNAATEAASRKGKNKILKLDDLMKYCEIEVASTFGSSNMRFGFEA